MRIRAGHVTLSLGLMTLAACHNAPVAGTQPKITEKFVRAVDRSTPAAVMYQAGKYNDALLRAQRDVETVQHAGGGKAQQVSALCFLGTIETTLAKYGDARKHLAEARGMLDEKDPADALQLAMIFVELAKLNYFTAEWDKAVDFAEKGMEIRKKNLPAEHPDVAESLALAGYFLTARDGEASETILMKSQEMQLEAWKIRVKVLGPDARETADSYNDLGLFFLSNLVDDEDVFPDATSDERTLRCLNRALEIRKRAVGAEHSDVGDSLMNLAYFNYERERQDDAAKDALMAIAIAEKTLGKEHPNVAFGYNLLGQIRSKQGRLLEAVAHLEKAQKIYEGTFGPDHFFVATVLDNLGAIYSDLGDSAKVKLIRQRLLRIRGREI